jgi:hypothetical protein
MTNGRKFRYALILGMFAATGSAWALDPVDHQPIAALVATLKGSGQVRIAQGMQDILASDSNGQLAPAASPLMLTTDTNTGAWTISVLDSKIVGSTVLIGTNLEKVSSDAMPALPTFDRAKAQEITTAMNARGTGYYPDEIERLTKEAGCKRLFTGNVIFVLNSALAMASANNQYKIDSNPLKFNIDGKDVTIAQGKLRQIMTDRVKALEAQAAQLKQSAGDPAEITRVDALLQKYGTEAGNLGQPTNPDFKNMKPVFADVLVSPNSDFHVLVVDQYGACTEIAAGDSFGDRR